MMGWQAVVLVALLAVASGPVDAGWLPFLQAPTTTTRTRQVAPKRSPRSRGPHASADTEGALGRLHRRCHSSCRGKLEGGQWSAHDRSEQCLTNGLYAPTSFDPDTEVPGLGFDFYHPNGYCLYWKVKGCEPWAVQPSWQHHARAEALLETFELLGISHIRFSGDSLSEQNLTWCEAGGSSVPQHYYSFVRELESVRAAPPVRVAHNPPKNRSCPECPVYVSPLHLYHEDAFRSAGGFELRTSLVWAQTPLGNMDWRANNTRHRRAELEWLFLKHVLPCHNPRVSAALCVEGFDAAFWELAQATACEPVDMLVVNYGAHYQYGRESKLMSAQQMMDLILPDHEALLETLGEYPKMVKVYRENTPLHGPGFGKPCRPMNATDLERLARERVTFADPRDCLGDNTAGRFQAAGVVFLQVFDLLTSQWQDHASHSDCLHWRIPGPISVWTDAMLDAVFCGYLDKKPPL